MNIKEYCEKAELTRATLELTLDDNIHMLFGMLTELGEITDVFKKELAYGKEVDWVNVKEEVGDLMWYIAGFCNINDFDLEEILQTNIDKLRARYPEKFTTTHALNRDLEKERSILEGTSELKVYDYRVEVKPQAILKSPQNVEGIIFRPRNNKI